MKIRFKKLSPEAITPTYGTEQSAGADLYSLSDGGVVIEPGQTVFIHTGIALEIPEGYVGLVFARSGMASKRGLAPSNKVGVVDSDYRGEIMVSLHNHSGAAQLVESGERIAQICFVPYIQGQLEECAELSETARGSGGFGSTGRK